MKNDIKRKCIIRKNKRRLRKTKRIDRIEREQRERERDRDVQCASISVMIMMISGAGCGSCAPQPPDGMASGHQPCEPVASHARGLGRARLTSGNTGTRVTLAFKPGQAYHLTRRMISLRKRGRRRVEALRNRKASNKSTNRLVIYFCFDNNM